MVLVVDSSRSNRRSNGSTRALAHEPMAPRLLARAPMGGLPTSKPDRELSCPVPSPKALARRRSKSEAKPSRPAAPGSDSRCDERDSGLHETVFRIDRSSFDLGRRWARRSQRLRKPARTTRALRVRVSGRPHPYIDICDEGGWQRSRILRSSPGAFLGDLHDDKIRTAVDGVRDGGVHVPRQVGLEAV